MTYARIVDENGAPADTGKVVEIVPWSPEGRYDPDWVWVECPDNTVQGATYAKGKFTNPEKAEPDAPEPTFRPLINRVEFKQLFTIEEQVKIRMARAYEGDDQQQTLLKFTLDAFYDVLEDPQLETINLEQPMVVEGLAKLEATTLIGEGRAEEIAKGVPESE